MLKTLMPIFAIVVGCHADKESYIFTAVASLLQQRVKVMFDWWEVLVQMRDVWKSITMDNGALCVMTVGTLLMPMWCAVSLATLEPHLHLNELSLVKALIQSTMTMWPALGVRHDWLTAHIMVLEFITVLTVKMQEWCVPLVHRVSLLSFSLCGSFVCI